MIKLTGSMVDMAKMTEFADMVKRKKELEEEVKKLNGKIEKLGDALVKQMQAAGMTKVSLSEHGTLFVKATVMPKFIEGKTREDVMKALKADGAGDIVKENYNTQTFAATVREIEANDEWELYGNLSQVVEATTQYKLTLRKK